MADNTKQQDNALISTEEVTTLNGGAVTAQQVQRFIASLRTADGTAADVTSAAPMPVGDAGSSLTVDAPLSSPVGVRLSDGTSALATTSSELHVRDATARTKLGEILTALGGGLSVSDVEAIALLEGSNALLETIGSLLSSIDADTGGMLTSLQLLDNAIAGSEMQVDVVGPLPAGTNAIGKLAGNSGVDIGDVDVLTLTGSTLAHGEADGSTKPHKIGGRGRTSLPAAEAQDDRVDAIFDKFGRQLATTAPLDQRVSGSIDLTDTTTTDVIASPGASIAIVVTDIEVINGDTTVGTFVEIFDDATKKWKGFAGANGGGFDHSNRDGMFVCTANKAVRAKCLTTSSETSVNISGYKIPA